MGVAKAIRGDPRDIANTEDERYNLCDPRPFSTDQMEEGFYQSFVAVSFKNVFQIACEASDN